VSRLCIRLEKIVPCLCSKVVRKEVLAWIVGTIAWELMLFVVP